VTDFRGRRGGLAGTAFTVGEHFLYFGWSDATGNLWLMEY
jgi:hypothetical protein